MLNKWRENTREILKLQMIMIQIINVKLQMIDAITYICENCLVSFIIHST